MVRPQSSNMQVESSMKKLCQSCQDSEQRVARGWLWGRNRHGQRERMTLWLKTAKWKGEWQVISELQVLWELRWEGDCGKLKQSGKVFSFFKKNKTWLAACGAFQIGVMGVGMEARINIMCTFVYVYMCAYVCVLGRGGWEPREKAKLNRRELLIMQLC